MDQATPKIVSELFELSALVWAKPDYLIGKTIIDMDDKQCTIWDIGQKLDAKYVVYLKPCGNFNPNISLRTVCFGFLEDLHQWVNENETS